MGRERIGVDKFGNKYYQYYTYHGLPTKRVVLYNFPEGSSLFEQDPHFVGWLRKNEILPPTPEELERLYLEHDAFIQRGIEWDEEQQLIIEEFNNRKKELDEMYDREQLTEGTKTWVPGTKAPEVEPVIKDDESDLEMPDEEEHSLQVISEIDSFEA